MKNTQKKSCMFACISILLLVMLDQFTKWLAIVKLKGKESVDIIKNVLEFAYLENRGAAFGMLQNQRIFFVILTVSMLIGIAYLFLKTPKTKKYLPLRICAVVITAGAIGNLIDRVLRGFVVDFIYFSLIDFPIFNVADCYVVISVILLVCTLLFYYKDEEVDMLMEEIWPSRRQDG